MSKTPDFESKNSEKSLTNNNNSKKRLKTSNKTLQKIKNELSKDIKNTIITITNAPEFGLDEPITPQIPIPTTTQKQPLPHIREEDTPNPKNFISVPKTPPKLHQPSYEAISHHQPKTRPTPRQHTPGRSSRNKPAERGEQEFKNYQIKCLVAFLSIHNVMLKGKLRFAQKKKIFSRIKEEVEGDQGLQIDRKNGLEKSVYFYQQKCVDLQLELSKLKNKMERMKTSLGRGGRSRVFADKENNLDFSNLGGRGGRSVSPGASFGRGVGSVGGFGGFGGSKKGLEFSQKKSKKGFKNRQGKPQKAPGRSRSHRGARSGRSNTQNSTKNASKKHSTRNLNIDPKGSKFDKKEFKSKYKLAETKGIVITQFLDNSRHPALDSLIAFEKLQLGNPGSEKNNQVVRQTKLWMKYLVFTKWKLKSTFPKNGIREFSSDLSLRKLLENPISSKLWDLKNLAFKLPSQLRLNKGYLTYERKLLDFEKEVFFKRRFRVLMSSILRETQRRLKLTKVVAFYKLIASSVFIDKEELGVIGESRIAPFHGAIHPPGHSFGSVDGQNLKDKIVSGGGLQADNESFFVNKSFFLLNRKAEDRSFPLNMMEKSEIDKANQKWHEGVKDPSILPNDLDLAKSEVDRYTVNSENYRNNSILKKGEIKGKSILKTKHRLLLEERRKVALGRVLYRQKIKLDGFRRRGLVTWYRWMYREQINELLVEFENMNIVLSERAFREKVFRTKIKLLQGKIDTQIGYFRDVVENGG